MKKLMGRYCIFTAFPFEHLGGVEKFSEGLSSELCDLGNEVWLITSSCDLQLSQGRESGINVIRLPSVYLMGERLPIPVLNFKARRALKVIFKTKFDGVLINTRFFPLSLIGVLYSVHAGNVPIILEHGSNYIGVGKALLDKIIRFYEKGITRIERLFNPVYYGVSEKSATWIRAFSIESSGVLHNGINSSHFLSSASPIDYRKLIGIDDSCLLIAFAGRMIKEKGFLKVINVVRQLKYEGENIHLVLAGSGPDANLIEIIDDDAITFVGRLNAGEMSALFKASDVFCFPTDYPEGLPTVLLEAATQQNCIIVSHTGGSDDLIPDGSYGIILKDTDEHTIKEALYYLLANPEKRINMASRVQEMVFDNFNFESIAEKFIDACSQINR